ncbi:hypothetical protein ACFLYX_02300 [Chloroflexota bacterium]
MIFDYLKRWRSRRLYKQWVKSSALAPEDVPAEETAPDVLPEIDTKKLRLPLLPLLYTLLGISIGILLTGVILFILKSC